MKGKSKIVNPSVEKLKVISDVQSVLLKMMIKRMKGRIFNAVFVKANSEERIITARTGVRKGVKGVRKIVEKDHLIGVYDMSVNDFRYINLKTLKSFKCGKFEYTIKN